MERHGAWLLRWRDVGCRCAGLAPACRRHGWRWLGHSVGGDWRYDGRALSQRARLRYAAPPPHHWPRPRATRQQLHPQPHSAFRDGNRHSQVARGNGGRCEFQWRKLGQRLDSDRGHCPPKRARRYGGDFAAAGGWSEPNAHLPHIIGHRSA